MIHHVWGSQPSGGPGHGSIQIAEVHERIDEAGPLLALLSQQPDCSRDATVAPPIFAEQSVTIHPFDDGNGRIARAIADMSLARAEGMAQRFYSMSAQIGTERND